MLLLEMMTGLLLLQGIVSRILCFIECLQTFYSEIALKSKNNPSLQAGLFLPEPQASVAGLVDDEVVSVRGGASADEAAAKSKRYAFLSVVSGYKITMFHSCIRNLADDSEEIPLAM